MLHFDQSVRSAGPNENNSCFKLIFSLHMQCLDLCMHGGRLATRYAGAWLLSCNCWVPTAVQCIALGVAHSNDHPPPAASICWVATDGQCMDGCGHTADHSPLTTRSKQRLVCMGSHCWPMQHSLAQSNIAHHVSSPNNIHIHIIR
jgi:hypothetical protein